MSPCPRFSASLCFSKSPGCYLSPAFVGDSHHFCHKQVSAVAQPCQDQVELERKKERSWQKQRCLLQWQIPHWRLWSWESSLQRGRMENVGWAGLITITIIMIVMIINVILSLFWLCLPTARGAWRYSAEEWGALWCVVNIRGWGFSWILKCLFTLQPLRRECEIWTEGPGERVGVGGGVKYKEMW